MLYDWQTLAGALLALLAALLGSWLLWRQINLSHEQEEGRRRRRFEATRATLPLILSEICEWARGAMRELRSIHTASDQHAFGADTLGFHSPAFPNESVAALERVIEATIKDDLADQVADILVEVQVLTARMRTLEYANPSRVGLQLNVEYYMIQAAKIFAQASSLLSFARREVDDANAGEKMSVPSALRVMDVYPHEFERIHETANRREQRRAISSNDGSDE